MDVLVGHFYYRKRTGASSVRRVISIEKYILYEYVHGPQMRKTRYGRTSHKNFLKWADGEIQDGVSFSSLDGAVIFEPIELMDENGKIILCCTPKKATWFVRKGIAVWDGNRLRSVGNQIVNRLRERYGENLHNPFFVDKKNKRCVVCGTVNNLTRHHIVPRRHLKGIPMDIRRCLSNILWVCAPCHKRYEEKCEPVEKIDPIVWRDHFVKTMSPSYIPFGWDIII
jgi:hypothetical protein